MEPTFLKLLLMLLSLVLLCTSEELTDGVLTDVHEAKPGQFPSLVALLDLELSFYANANLISPSFIITAAKTFEEGRVLMAFAGDISINETFRNHRELRSIIRIISHPKSDDISRPEFGIALAMISHPFKFSQDIRPLRFSQKRPIVGTLCFNVGWNLISQPKHLSELQLLQYRFVKILPNKDCKIEGIENSQVICAAGAKDKVTVNYPGSPLICSRMQSGVLVQNSKYNSSNADLFSNIETVTTWIERETEWYIKSLDRSGSQSLENGFIAVLLIFLHLFINF